MKVLLILGSDSAEIKWNTIRFGNVMLNEYDDVTLFLNGPAAALYQGDSETFPIREQAKIFSLGGGVIVA